MKLGFSVLLFLFGFKVFAGSFDFPAGHYEMELKVGEKVFHDSVDIQVESAGSLNSTLSGILTVPGAFASPLTGSSRYAPWAGVHYFSFAITATENGESYKVFYTGRIQESFANRGFTIMKGEARFEDESLLGTFTATLSN